MDLKPNQNFHKARSRIPVKIHPDRIQDVLKSVKNRYGKMSPIGCSKNVLAMNSNIDKEIEHAKQKISILDTHTEKLFSQLNHSPIRISKLPILIVSPRKIEFREHSSPLDRSEKALKTTKRTSFSHSRISIARIEKINNIISDCRDIEKTIQVDSNQSERRLKRNHEDFGKIAKILEGVTLEEGLIKRCKTDAKEFFGLHNKPLSTARVLKRGKKVWKQNHIKFITGLDKIMYSFNRS